MINPTKQSPKQFWQMRSRSVYPGMPIFKMKLRQQTPRNKQPYEKPHILFPLTKAKKVLEYSADLKTLLHTYNFQYDPHALEIMSVDKINADLKMCIVTGSSEGKIICQPLIIHQTQQQSTAQQQQQFSCFTLNNNQDKNPPEIFINEIHNLGRGRMVNCFNNGTLAFWDLAQRKRIHTMERVHSSYTYKLRQVEERLISCGHDGMAVVTDLLKLKTIRGLQNADSCWCAFPINYNVISSVGLFNRVNLWDVRTRSLIQSIPLQNQQTSFITAFDHNSLVFGDENILKKCDLRVMSCQPFTSQQMLLSAEHIIVDKDGGYACGRKNEVCRFEGVDQLHPQIKAVKASYDPYHPEQFMSSSVLNNDMTNFNPIMLRHFLAQMLAGNDPMEQEDEQDWEMQQQQQQEEQIQELYQEEQEMEVGENSQVEEMEQQQSQQLNGNNNGSSEIAHELYQHQQQQQDAHESSASSQDEQPQSQHQQSHSYQNEHRQQQ